MRGPATAAALAAATAAVLAGCAASQPGAAVSGHAVSGHAVPARTVPGHAVPGTAAASRSTAAAASPAGEPAPAVSLPVSLPSPDSVSYADPTAVSRAAVIIQWSMDTVTDSSQYQAELRSAPFLTPAYLAQLRANPPVAAPGYQWDQWSAHRAYTTVSLIVEPDDQPADTATTAYRQWGITVTPRGTGGWTGAPLAVTVFVQLTRSGSSEPWLVSAILADPS